MKQTSDRISSLAGRYANISNTALKEKTETREGLNEVAHDIRSMAASLLAQDEVRGFRKLWKKVTGK